MLCKQSCLMAIVMSAFLLCSNGWAADKTGENYDLTAASCTAQVYVDAYNNATGQNDGGWLDTGIQLAGGVQVNISISATGTACLSGSNTAYCCGPDGKSSWGSLNGCYYGALVGKIGTGSLFSVGSSYNITTTNSGRLYLAFNDSGYSSNSGGYNVCVNVASQPSPTPTPTPAMTPTPTPTPSPTPASTPTPMPSPTPPPDNSCTAQVYVDAYNNSSAQSDGGWLDTGIELTVGQQISVSASGSACLSGPNYCCGPDGNSSWGTDHGCSNGALMGKVGTGDVVAGDRFCVGSSYNGTAVISGHLFLAFNDTNYSNNTGGFYACIKPGSRPSPAPTPAMTPTPTPKPTPTVSPSPTPAPSTSASISGTVYQSDGVTPLTGVSNLNIWAGTGTPCGASGSVSWASYSTVNPATGTFTVGSLSAGSYYLVAYSSAYFDWWASPQGVTNCAGAQLVTVTAGQSVTGMSFILPSPTPAVTPIPTPSPTSTPTPKPTPIATPTPTPMVSPSPTPVPSTTASISGTVYQSDGVTPLTGVSSLYIWAGTGTPCGASGSVSCCLLYTSPSPRD